MNALHFHKMFVEQNNSTPGIKAVLGNKMNTLSVVSNAKPEFPTSVINNNQSPFPWEILLLACATIGMIIYLRNNSQKQNSELIS